MIGAGAVGGALGGRLALAGRQVVLVARGPHLDRLQRVGLRLRTPDEDVTQQLPAIGSPSELRLTEDDVLILATKSQQAEAALLAWADVPVHRAADPVTTAGARLPVLVALNGVAAETVAQRYFRRVYGVCVWMPVVHLEPGEVIIRSTPRSGMLHLGRVPARTDDADRAFLASVATDLDAANFDAPLPHDVMRWKYRKLISNLGNVFQALVARNGDWRPLVAGAEAEATRILDAAGISYVGSHEERAARAAGFTMKPVPGVPAFVGGSTWQSLVRGTGNVETDFLNGEIVAIAHRIGLEAPVNALLARLGREAALTGRQPGELSAGDLAAWLAAVPERP